MSKTTLRKRISLVAIAGLGAGLLSVVTAVPASANSTGVTNHVGAAGEFNVATEAAALSSGGTPTAVAVAKHLATANTSTSLGLVYKDYSSTTAQSATMLANGTLGLYTVGTATTVTVILPESVPVVLEVVVIAAVFVFAVV